MSQEDIICCLEKNKKPMSRGQIAKQLNFDAVRVSHALSKLLKSKEVKCQEITCEQAMKFYGCHRRMLIYYV